MFQGEGYITIDEKGRLAIPTAHRDVVSGVCGNRLVVTYNPYETGCLWLFPQERWERIRDEVSKLSSANPSHRLMQMKLVGAATFVDVDGNGRIVLPASHRTITGMGRKAVLMGLTDKLALWSEQAHLERMHQCVSEEDITDAMLQLDL